MLKTTCLNIYSRPSHSTSYTLSLSATGPLIDSSESSNSLSSGLKIGYRYSVDPGGTNISWLENIFYVEE